MNEKREYMEIDLLAILKALFKRWWLILIAVVVGALLVNGYAQWQIDPVYQSYVLMYVNNAPLTIGSTTVSVGTNMSARDLVDRYIVILKTRLTLETVIKEAELPYSYETLRSMISAGPENDTEIFRITVTSHDPKEACDIATTIAAVLPEQIDTIIDGTRSKIVDMAVVPRNPSGPNYSRYTMLGAVVGAVLSCAAIALYEFFNDIITSADWITENYKEECPLLSVIPRSSANARKYGRYGRYGKYGRYRYGKYGYGYGYGRNRNSSYGYDPTEEEA